MIGIYILYNKIIFVILVKTIKLINIIHVVFVYLKKYIYANIYTLHFSISQNEICLHISIGRYRALWNKY